MAWVLQLYLIILLVGSGLSLAVAAVAWRRREVTAAVSMTGLMLAVAWWQLMGVLEIIATDLRAKILCSQLLYLGVATVPVWWFLFALDYSGTRRRLSSRAAKWLWLIPALTIVVAFTQGWHTWLWSQVTLQANGIAHYTYGWWFLVHAVYSYALIVSGVILLIRTAWRLSRSQWRQMILLTVASLFPITLNALYLTHWGPLPDLDLTAVGFAVAGLVMVWNVFGLHFFDLSPVARDLLVESMDDGVIVLDRDNRIVDINPAGQRLIGTAQSPIGQAAATVFAAWPDLVERYRVVEQAQAEIRLDSAVSPEPMFVELHIVPLRNRHGQLLGRLVNLHDVTRRRQTEMRLRQLSRAVEQSPASIMITDLDGRIQYVNPKFTELTGYEAHELIGRYSNILKSGETPQEEYARLWQTIQAGHEWRGEFHNKKKNGELYWESAIISPISDAHGQVTFFLAVKEDITARKQAEAIEQQRHQRQQLVSEISVAINLSEGVQSIMQAAVDGLTRVLGIDQVGLALFDETRQHLMVRAYHAASGNQSAVGVELPLVGNLSTQRVVETRQPLMIMDAQHDSLLSNVREVMVRQQVQSILLVPLIVREEVIGTIGLDVLHTPRAFTPDEIDLACTVANLVAIRLEQARLFEAEREARLLAQRHALDLSGLYAVTRATSRSLVVEDVLAQALSAALTSLQFEAGLIALPRTNGAARDNSAVPDLQLAAERGLPVQLRATLMKGAGPLSLLAHAYGQREVALIDLSQPAVDPRFQQAAGDIGALGWQMVIGIPLLHRDQPLGVMCLLTHQARAASPIDMALFASMGHQVAAAISNAQLFQTTLDERSRLKALIESSRDGIILNSIDGTILVMNVPALTMLRMPGTPSDWVNRPILEAIQAMRHAAPLAARATIKELRRLTTAAEPTAEGDYEVFARPIHWQSLPVHVGTRPMGRLIVMRDMTEEHALERLREDMTHTMVHDLRNPLTGIVAALNMVLDGLMGDLRPEQRHVLSIAQSSSDRMMQLVNAILDVNRLESGRMPVNLTTVNVNDLLRGTLAAQMAIAQEKRIQLDCELPPDLPAVQADIALMQRVLQNLIGNAVKFTPEGGCIRVVAASVPVEFAKPSKVLITIQDNGPGIPLEIQSQLFQKFVTGGQQQEHGSGLGLAFCKLALEAHGQRIWVESTTGEGTTFTFTLAVAA
jgi:PAS domain S-box-containing protein